MTDDKFKRMTQIEDHKEAIDFYTETIKWLQEQAINITALKKYVLDKNDFPGMMNEPDTIAKVCCEYLIRYLDDGIDVYDACVRDEQNAIMELES